MPTTVTVVLSADQSERPTRLAIVTVALSADQSERPKRRFTTAIRVAAVEAAARHLIGGASRTTWQSSVDSNGPFLRGPEVSKRGLRGGSFTHTQSETPLYLSSYIISVNGAFPPIISLSIE